MSVHKVIEQTSVAVNRYTCDRCGLEADGRHTCCLCKRDLCRDCSIGDPRDTGDHPAIYCKGCWKMGEKYRAWIDRFEVQEEGQRTLWKIACVQARRDAERVAEELRAKVLSGDRGEKNP